MFDHVGIHVSDGEAWVRFYDTVLAALGIEKDHGDEQLAEWGDFALSPATAERPVTRGVHIGFAAPSREHVDAFWRAGTAAGYRDDGEPGPRPQYSEDYYGGFLLDPDGNSAEAVHHGDAHARDAVDHVWIRVADVAAAKRFYETVAPFAGYRLTDEVAGRASFGNGLSFSVVTDERPRTENLHVAFKAPDDATVDAFHRAALDAGYRDNGAPGERPEYHPGYYGAFVLDPDGTNVELVHHHR